MGTSKIYSFDKFREGQKEVIEKLLASKDCITIANKWWEECDFYCFSNPYFWHNSCCTAFEIFDGGASQEAKRNWYMAFYVN